MKPAHLWLSEEAAVDIIDQADWYASRADRKLADRWQRAVTSAALRILRNPRSGPLCRFSRTELSAVRRAAIAGFSKHLVFYRVEDNTVLVLRVLHGARDLENLFE